MSNSVLALTPAIDGQTDGCVLWRVLMPFSELQRQGYHKNVQWGPLKDPMMEVAIERYWFDAVILPRWSWPMHEKIKGKKWLDAFRKAGKAVIYDTDDDLFSDDFVRRIMDNDLCSLEEAEERRDSVLYAMQNSDGITVSCQRLATMARQYINKPIKVVDNYIDWNWYKRVQSFAKREVPGLTIGWVGSIRPDTDLEMMAEAWGRIAKKYPHVTFVIQGRNFEIFHRYVPIERTFIMKWLPIAQYPMGLVNIDIGCCAIADTKFNRAKTFIKAMEYTVSGAAVVASPTVYHNLIDHGIDGFIANNVDEWEEYLSLLIENKSTIKFINNAMTSKILAKYTLEDNAWRWIEAWDEIIGSFRNNRRRILLPSEVSYA